MGSSTVAILFILYGLLAPAHMSRTLGSVREIVVDVLGPVYPVTVTAVLLLVLGVAASPVGRLRMGGPDARPEFSVLSWIAMLMSAGVGMSFLFWGTAEPLIHLADPPVGAADPGSVQAARDGVRYSFLFWGPHAWALYALVAISVGWSAYTHGRRMLVSAALHPLLGRHADGLVGRVVDIISVLAILVGVATSLGLGAGELNAGLDELIGMPDSYTAKVVIIATLMTVSTISALTGLGRGIRILSLTNLFLCAVLLLFVLVAGPTEAILGTLGTGVRDFVTHLGPMSVGTEGAVDGQWTQDWIYFFWAWWIGWAPFIGIFVARISYGRTIRGLVVGVVAVPSTISVAWFSVFGGTALERELSGAVDVAGIAGESKSVATLAVLETLPMPALTLSLLVPVLALLFITSADSASFMLGSTTSGGTLRPPKPLRLTWSFAAAFAAVLLLGNGPDNLRNAAVVAALPFLIILVALGVSLLLSLSRDRPAHGA